MKTYVILAVAAFVLAGCGSRGGSAALGGVAGATAGAGGYEYHLGQERDRVRDAYDAHRITREEYEVRMDQIDRDSALGL